MAYLEPRKIGGFSVDQIGEFSGDNDEKNQNPEGSNEFQESRIGEMPARFETIQNHQENPGKTIHSVVDLASK